MNPIAIWCKYKDYGDWCYQYRIPTKEEFVEGFKYEFAELTITRTKEGKTRPFYAPTDFEIEPFWKEYIVGNNNDHKHVQKWLENYLENGYIRIKKAEKIDNMPVYESKTEKSKYKLDFDLIRPNLKILSNLYIKNTFINHIFIKGKKKGKIIWKSINILKPIIPKFLTIVDNINKYTKRFTSIKEGWKPIWTIKGREDRLKHFIRQPEKSPKRLVYIATKDGKQIARVPWWEANGPNYLGSPNTGKDKWEYISKKEGKRRMRPVAGNSLTPALGNQFYTPREKYIPPKSSTKRILTSNGYKSKRSHPGRIQEKSTFWNVTLIKDIPSAVGKEIYEEKKFVVKASSKGKAITKAYNKMYKDKVVLKTVKPYYKAVAERYMKSDTIHQLNGDRSMVSSLEPKKRVLITKMKDGSKKIEEIVTYKRNYPELHPPWTTNKEEKKKKWGDKDFGLRNKTKVKKIVVHKRHRTKEQIKLQREKYELNHSDKG